MCVMIVSESEHCQISWTRNLTAFLSVFIADRYLLRYATFAPTLQMHHIKCMTIKRGNGIIIVSGHAHKCHVIRNAICRRRTTSTKLLIGSSFWPYEFWSNNAFVISARRNTRFCSRNPCGLRMRIMAHKYTVMTYRITHALSNYTNILKYTCIYIYINLY